MAAFVLGAILAVRTRSLVSKPGASRSLWTSLAALEAAQLLLLAPVRRRLETRAGAAGLARVLAHGLVMVAAGGVRALLADVYADGDRPGRVRQGQLLVGAAGLTALASPFVIVGPRQAAAVASGLSARRDRLAASSLVLSWSGYLTYLSWALAGSSRLCWTYSQQAPPGPTRTGLTLTGAGSAAGFAYVALKANELLRWARQEPHDLLGQRSRAQPAIHLVVFTLIAVGSGYEALHERAGAHRDTRQARASVRHLFPLWQLVLALFPEQVLFPYPHPAPRLGSAKTLRFLELRRRTEIRDGLRNLEDYISGQTQAAALAEAHRHAAGSDAHALATAACLRLAGLVGRQPPGATRTVDVTDPQRMVLSLAGADLEQVAGFVSSPLAADIARRLVVGTAAPQQREGAPR